MGEWESTRSPRRTAIDQFFPWLIGAAVAPRRYIYAEEMGWENYATYPGWDRLQKVFALCGLIDNLDRAYGFGAFPGPGECANIGPAQRSKLYPMLQRWFGIPIPAAEPDDRRPEEDLAALTPAIAARLHMRSLHDLAYEIAAHRLEAVRARRQALGTEARRDVLIRELAARLGDIEPNRAPAVRVHWNKPYLGSVRK